MISYRTPLRVEQLGHDGIQYVAQMLEYTPHGLVIEHRMFLNSGREENCVQERRDEFNDMYAVPGQKWPLASVRRVCRWATVVNNKLVCVPNKDVDSHLAYSGFAMHLQRVFGVKLHPHRLNIVTFGNNTVLDLNLDPPEPFNSAPTVLTVAPDLLTAAVGRGRQVVAVDLDI